MKNKSVLLFGGVILVILLIFGTYAWYLYFLNFSDNNSKKSNNTNTSIKVGDLEFKEDGKPVYDANAKSIEDKDVKDIPAYSFRIINNGNSDKDYTLLIEDIPANLVDDGCSEDNLLSRKDLKYQLRINNEIVKEDFLANIKDNILDTKKLESKKTNIYSLKVYIHESAKDWFGKHYHYKVVLKK